MEYKLNDALWSVWKTLDSDGKTWVRDINKKAMIDEVQVELLRLMVLIDAIYESI